MDIIRDRKQVSRLEIVDSGRRRRFSDEAKLAIVAESLSAPRQVQSEALATVTTMLSPKRSMVFTRPRSSIGEDHGATSKPWSSPRSNGSTGCLIAS